MERIITMELGGFLVADSSLMFLSVGRLFLVPDKTSFKDYLLF